VTPAILNWSPPGRTGAVRIAVLTARQTDVLHGMTLGLSNERIARRLDVTETTVKTHVKAVLSAMHADNRAHAVALAYTGQVRVVVKASYAAVHAMRSRADLTGGAA
jgi:DNA-binding NarL/FixJ family response regulator